jgi:hypothetical protein
MMQTSGVIELARKISGELEKSGLREPYKSAAFKVLLEEAVGRQAAGTSEGRQLIEFQDEETPVFHFRLPSESRAETQKQALLLLLLALKRSLGRTHATSNELSRMLRAAGMDNGRIDIAVSRLKKEEPKLVSAVRRGRKLSLTAAGEQRAEALWAQLQK